MTIVHKVHHGVGQQQFDFVIIYSLEHANGVVKTKIVKVGVENGNGYWYPKRHPIVFWKLTTAITRWRRVLWVSFLHCKINLKNILKNILLKWHRQKSNLSRPVTYKFEKLETVHRLHNDHGFGLWITCTYSLSIVSINEIFTIWLMRGLNHAIGCMSTASWHKQTFILLRVRRTQKRFYIHIIISIWPWLFLRCLTSPVHWMKNKLAQVKGVNSFYYINL